MTQPQPAPTVPNPTRRTLGEIQKAAPKEKAHAFKPPKPPRAPGVRRQVFGPAFWTVTGILSLMVNAILIIALLVALPLLNRIGVKSLVGGLYDNFVLMDQAVIATTIPIDKQVPIKFTLPVNRQTEVVLTRNVTLEADVVINTGGVNIDAPAVITLRQGTVLPIELKMDVPVDQTVQIKMDVPASIPLKDTGLHTPLTGLQTVIAPLYCLVSPGATSNGKSVCP